MNKDPLRDIAIGVLVIAVGSAIVAFAGIPSKVAVLESSQVKTEKTIERIDSKLDDILNRLPRR